MFELIAMSCLSRLTADAFNRRCLMSVLINVLIATALPMGTVYNNNALRFSLLI